MITNTYLNLATKDVAVARNFFTQLGFSINETFSDEHTICVIVNEHTFMMVMTKERFETFTQSQTTDSFSHHEVIISFEKEHQSDVDEIIEKVILSGGSEFGQKVENDFMYYRSFNDPDNHRFEVFSFKK